MGNGTIASKSKDKIVLKQGDRLVTLRRNVRHNGKKIADKNWILTAYDETAGDDASAISGTNQGQAAQTPADSVGKDTQKLAKAKASADFIIIKYYLGHSFPNNLY